MNKSLIKAQGTARPKNDATVAEDLADRMTVSMPHSEWIRHFDGKNKQKLTDDDLKAPTLGEYFKFFKNRAKANGYSGTVSGIVQMALDDMWRRRHEPDRKSAESLVSYGVNRIADDFFELDFSEALVDANEVVLQTSSLARVVARQGTMSSLVRRIQSGKKTTLIFQHHRTADGGFVPDSEQQSLSDVLKAVGPRTVEKLLSEEVDVEGDPLRDSKRFTLFLRTVPRGAPFDEIFWTDSECYVAPSYLAVSNVQPALHYIPSRQPKTFSSRSLIPVGGVPTPVTLSAPTVEFHTHIRAGITFQFMHGGMVDHSERVLRIHASKFPSTSTQPTP